LRPFDTPFEVTLGPSGAFVKYIISKGFG
jgi:hypothetical protein